jgi:hypothetical protein
MNLQKRNYIRSKKILDSAKGEKCTVESPICNDDRTTTVACHSDYMEDGKGKGIKAEDIYIAYGCFNCHQWLTKDVVNDLKEMYFHRGMKRTWKRLIEKGIIKIG